MKWIMWTDVRAGRFCVHVVVFLFRIRNCRYIVMYAWVHGCTFVMGVGVCVCVSFYFWPIQSFLMWILCGVSAVWLNNWTFNTRSSFYCIWMVQRILYRHYLRPIKVRTQINDLIDFYCYNYRWWLLFYFTALWYIFNTDIFNW